MPMDQGGMTPNPGNPTGNLAGKMAPSVPAQPAEAEVEQKAVESLNVAEAGAMEALEAAQAAPQVGEETEAKIENAVILLDEAKQEIAATAPGAEQQRDLVPSGGEG